MLNLFEYQNKEHFSGDLGSLEAFLDGIWENRDKATSYYDEEDKRKEVQQFLQVFHKTHEIKSNKYVGVIRHNHQTINLLPKIFHQKEQGFPSDYTAKINAHILWWLSYSSKIKFPNYATSLGNIKSDFFDILIFLFAKYTRHLLSHSIYQQYREVNREQSFIKGRLNTNAYLTENLSRGRWHKINCTYDEFGIDNKFNRILKYVTKLLLGATSDSENKKLLREILFTLDEVSDVKAHVDDCTGIIFSPVFEEFIIVRDYCRLFLSNSINFSYKDELKLFAFLLPMEKVFEDFITGFIRKELPEVKVKSQSKSKYLDTGKVFNIQPDLIITANGKDIIADTKYKIVYENESDPKEGVSQSDLYQMVAYAVRHKIDFILLLYPSTVFSYLTSVKQIDIVEEFAGTVIRVRAHQIPVINNSLLDMEKFPIGERLESIFSETMGELRITLRNLFA